MSGFGGSLFRVRVTLFGIAALLALTACFAWSGAASAAGPAKAGSSFATSFLSLPKGATPGGNSGFGASSVEVAPLSSNGRYVAFVSSINSLSRAAHPDATNIYRKDRQTGAVELVSRKSGKNGAGLPKNSREPRISANGNLVAFLTAAALVPADVDGAEDVYIRNVATGKTTLATPNTTLTVFQFDLSADGKYIAFSSPEALAGTDLNGQPDVFRRNLNSGVVDLVSRITASETTANNYSDFPSISGDGRWVAFRSAALGLVAPFIDGNGPAPDIFARDMTGAATFLVSMASDEPLKGGNGESTEPAIAGTPAGSAEVKVAYTSYATNVAAGGVDPSAAASVYLKSNLAVTPSTLVSQSTGGQNADSRAHTPAIGDNGNRILFSSDAGNLGAGADYYGAYLRDINAGTTTLGSARNEYAIAGGISGLGNLIAWSEAGDATTDSDPDAFGVFTRSVPGGPVRLVSRPKGNKPFLVPGAMVESPSAGRRTISANGRYVVFALSSRRLSSTKGFEIFRRDLRTGRIQLVSRKSGKSGARSGGSTLASISNDGNRVGFVSYLPLVAADTDDKADAYIRDLKTNTTTLVSRADGPAGAVANESVESAAISGNGRRVAFATMATNFGVPGNKVQVYVRDIAAGETILTSRATGPAGVAGNNNSASPSISNNGQVVVFRSPSTNLDPADAELSTDIYVRNLATDSLVLVSREPGLAGNSSPGFEFDPTISGDGKVVAFLTSNEDLVPATAPWPPADQVVSRVIADGTNTLVSRTAGGSPGDGTSNRPSINRDGSVIAFVTVAENLLPGRGGADRSSVLIRNMKIDRLTGPPAFGLKNNEPQQRADNPSVSDNGRCVSFNAFGHNRVSGDLSDIPSAYVYVASGTCWNPRGTPKPKLSKVQVAALRVNFRLNAKATVTISFERKTAGGYSAFGKIVRKNQKAGKRSLRYNGKVGKKELKPGLYRVTLVAKNSSGSSKKVRQGLKVRPG